MRILFFSLDYGGVTTTFIRNELDHFSENHEIRYLCQRLNPEAAIPHYVELIPFYQNRLVKKFKWLLWKNDIACNHYSYPYSKVVKRYVQDFAPDIIHCHFAFEGLLLLDNIDTDTVKIILHFHGYDATQLAGKKSYLRRLKKLLEKPNVSAVVCCKYFLNKLVDLLMVDESKFFLLYYGIDIAKFTTANVSPKLNRERIFVQVSSLMPKKGHEYTLRAFAELKNRLPHLKCKLILTGDGVRAKLLKSLAHELEIDEEVDFIGNISAEEAVELLRRADVFVHHSVTDSNGDMEGIPNSIIEAMAMELPVVSTWHSGISELVEDGVNGYLVKEKDVVALTDKLIRALDMGKLPRNRTKVVEEFNKHKHNVQLESYYNWLLNVEVNRAN